MVKSKRARPTRKDAEKIYLWCVKAYGRSKRNGPYPELLFRKPDYYLGDNEGHYDPYDNLIYINRSKCTCLYDLIDTILHEWTHYMQPIKQHLRNTDYNQWDDPYEKEAREVAKRDRSKCYCELYKPVK